MFFFGRGHQHEWQYRDLGMGPERTRSEPDAQVCIRTARMFHLKFCKCGKFEVDMCEGLKLSGIIPKETKDKHGDRFSEMYFVKKLLKELAYDLSMTFDKEFSNYVI